ncbi:MAG: polyprenyl diphosphate synthase [Oscillospiraceae bacterium]|nr:polyprenyl diphosphate synthase [Oscillospiraceae bacterium]
MNNDFKVPCHVAIIMDGNGRWAKAQGKPRSFGHIKGALAFRRALDACIELQVPFVTFYAFSTENWKRPKIEIDTLFKLFNSYLDEFMNIHKRNARLKFIGDINALDEKLVKRINEAVELTADNTGTTVSIAINYGGQFEILNAVKNIINSGVNPDSLTPDLFESYLYTAGSPCVDLMLRTGGDSRISNFLLWQSAYAELDFTDVLWPDFDKDDLINAFRQYSAKERRFGAIDN